ncbi:hypothetical protein [Mangrovibacterium diazotrophicum]|uniref:Lipoprotein n=1 Tax=Mangrovibacterium diazotrophicum TaxID=1261403 RepID=A0A419W9D8_9BACT|nr:hypothetical protein [Mangrovibacterium diazotrophicum]RKD92046.1 hypothetical protein BC643_2416 [Mangrovibacterium diazotrophicum]
MKTRNFLVVGILIAGATLSFSACSKDDNNTPEDELSDETIALVQESANGDMLEEELDASVQEAIAYTEENAMQTKSASAESDCAVITYTPEDGTFPRTISVDFGEGCESIRGVTRSGSITILLTDTLKNTGAEYTVTFNNYQVENTTITGSKSVTNIGTPAAPSFTDESQLELTTPAGIVITKSKSIIREQIEGIDTYSVVDDVFLISGSSATSSSAGRSYSYIIVDPLKVARTCENILSGVAEINWNGQSEPVTIDYGDGDCDWKVYVSRARRIIRRQVLLN